MLLEKKTRKARRTEKKGRGVGHQEKNADKRRVMPNKTTKNNKKRNVHTNQTRQPTYVTPYIFFVNALT